MATQENPVESFSGDDTGYELDTTGFSTFSPSEWAKIKLEVAERLGLSPVSRGDASSGIESDDILKPDTDSISEPTGATVRESELDLETIDPSSILSQTQWLALLKQARDYTDNGLRFGDPVYIPESEIQNLDPVVRENFDTNYARLQLFKELFGDTLAPKRRRRVILSACSACNELFSIENMYKKSVVFEPYRRPVQGEPSSKKSRIIAWLCPLCLIEDPDYRRPRSKSTTHSEYARSQV